MKFILRVVVVVIVGMFGVLVIQAQDATDAPPVMFVMPGGSADDATEAPPPMFIMPGADTATPVPMPTATATPIPDITFNGLSYQYAERGIWFLPDVTINNHSNENLRIYLWYRDQASSDFIRNPMASDDFRNDTNTLYVTEAFTPQQNNQRFSGNDLALYLPYYEFPRGNYTYAPYITIYDENLNLLASTEYRSTVIASADHPAPATNILIRDIEFDFGDSGITYRVDMDVMGYYGEDLQVVTFFGYNESDLINNALPLEDYYQTDAGRLIGWADFCICSANAQTFTDDNRIEVYVPYNAFPAATYWYYPIVTVQRLGETEALETRYFRDKLVDVLGDEPPAGYIVNYRIDELSVGYTWNWGSPAYGSPEWDDLLLIYGAYEIDNNGELIPGEQYYWTKYIWSNTRHTEDFETLLIDIPADSYFIVRFDYVEVVDLEATEDAIEGLRDAGKVAKAGARFITNRLARVAAKSILRYGNGVMLINDIHNFFAEDYVMDTEERSYSPEDLYEFYLATGAVRDRESNIPRFVDLSDDGWVTREIQSDATMYNTKVKFWLYGYPAQRAR